MGRIETQNTYRRMRIAARFMRQDFFQFVPQFKRIIAGNHKPGLSTADEAMRRRFNLVPFSVTIPAAERDAELAEKLREEWGSILQWMINGCLTWQEQGLNSPAIVKHPTEDYLLSLGRRFVQMARRMLRPGPKRVGELNGAL